MNTHRRLCWLSYPLAHLVIWCVALQRFFILSEEACVPAYLAFLCMCSHKDMSSKQYAHKTGYYIYIYICIYIYEAYMYLHTHTHVCNTTRALIVFGVCVPYITSCTLRDKESTMAFQSTHGVNGPGRNQGKGVGSKREPKHAMVAPRGHRPCAC